MIEGIFLEAWRDEFRKARDTALENLHQREYRAAFVDAHSRFKKYWKGVLEYLNVDRPDEPDFASRFAQACQTKNISAAEIDAALAAASSFQNLKKQYDYHDAQQAWAGLDAIMKIIDGILRSMNV